MGCFANRAESELTSEQRVSEPFECEDGWKQHCVRIVEALRGRSNHVCSSGIGPLRPGISQAEKTGICGKDGRRSGFIGFRDKEFAEARLTM